MFFSCCPTASATRAMPSAAARKPAADRWLSNANCASDRRSASQRPRRGRNRGTARTTGSRNRRLSEDLETLRGQQQNQEKEALALDHEHRKLAEEFARSSSRLSVARWSWIA